MGIDEDEMLEHLFHYMGELDERSNEYADTCGNIIGIEWRNNTNHTSVEEEYDRALDRFNELNEGTMTTEMGWLKGYIRGLKWWYWEEDR